MNVTEELRASVETSIDSIEVAALRDPAEIAGAAKRRQRRQRSALGGAAIALVCLAFLSVAALRPDGITAEVYASDADQVQPPTEVIRSGDRYIGISSVNPFDFDDLGNATAQFVESSDGATWTPVDGARTLLGQDFRLIERNGMFHLHTSRFVAASPPASDGDDTDPSSETETASQDGAETATEYDQEFFVSTSADLISWQERQYEMPEELIIEGHDVQVGEIELLGDALFATAGTFPSVVPRSAKLEALGYDWASICESTGTSSTEVRFRQCGSIEEITLEYPEAVYSSLNRFLIKIEQVRGPQDKATVVTLPDIDGFQNSISGQSQLFVLDEDRLGLAGYQPFQTADGTNWTQIETKRDFGAMVATRGDEWVYRTPRPVRRTGDNDIAVGMAFSSNGGQKWTPTTIDDLFDEAPTTPSWFSQLEVGEAGWAFVVQRNLHIRPEIAGVELTDPGGTSDFTITTDTGFVLSGETPYGAAELVNFNGRLIKSWEVLEVANPVWSGLEIIDGDVVLLADDGEEIVARFTGEQWRALIDQPGANHWDVVFSPDGVEWSIIDSGTSIPRVMAIGADEVLVQHRQPGVYSLVVPEVDVISIPIDS